MKWIRQYQLSSLVQIPQAQWQMPSKESQLASLKQSWTRRQKAPISRLLRSQNGHSVLSAQMVLHLPGPCSQQMNPALLILGQGRRSRKINGLGLPINLGKPFVGDLKQSGYWSLGECGEFTVICILMIPLREPESARCSQTISGGVLMMMEKRKTLQLWAG